MVATLQQQSAYMAPQNHVALQRMEATRLAVKAFQQLNMVAL